MIEDVAAYEPWPSFAPHSAAKAAQAMLTRVFARALAPEVRVCGIAPGPVAVEPGQEERRAAETLLGRIGSPEDVADAVLYLAGSRVRDRDEPRGRRRETPANRASRRSRRNRWKDDVYCPHTSSGLPAAPTRHHPGRGPPIR